MYLLCRVNAYLSSISNSIITAVDCLLTVMRDDHPMYKIEHSHLQLLWYYQCNNDFCQAFLVEILSTHECIVLNKNRVKLTLNLYCKFIPFSLIFYSIRMLPF